MLKKIGSFFSFIFGSIFGLVFFALALLSLPLNVIVWMRWMGWEWWGGLIASIASFMVPALGQLAYMLFTFVGLYYFYDAGWSWREAAYSKTQTYSVDRMSPHEFERFMVQTWQPALVQECEIEAKSRVGFDGKIPEAAARYCACLGKVAGAVTTQADMIYGNKNKTEPPGLRERMAKCVQAECTS